MKGKRDPGSEKAKRVDHANELERQKAFIELLIETIPLPVFHKDAEGIYTGCNRAFEEYTGRSREEVIGKSVFDMVPRDIAEKYSEKDEELFINPGKQTYEWKIKGKDGQLREVLFHKASIPGPDGKVIGLIGIITDITERKWIEETLKESENRLSSYIEHAPVGVFLADETGRYIEVNPEACRITGYSREELLSMKIPDLVPPDHLGESMQSFGNLKKTGKTYSELPFLHRDGSTRFWSVNAVSISPVRFIAYVQDITERKQIEDELRESEARLKRSQQIAHVGSWEYDMKTGKIWGSDEGFRIYGMTSPPSNFLVIDEIEACIPEKGMVHQALVDLIENNKPYDLEFVINPADGSPQRTIVSKAEITRGPDGEAVKVCGVLKDITDQKQTENALRESEYRHNLAGKLASFGWWTVDLATNRSTWSDEVAAIHEMPPGYSPILEEGINFYAPEYRERITEVVQKCAQDGTSFAEELQIITKSGRRVWVRTIGMAQRDDRGRIVGLLGGFQEITRCKQFEEELREQRWRLESIIEGANIATWEWNVQTGETIFNDTWAQMIGYTLEEISPTTVKTWEKLLHPEDLKISTGLLERHFNGEMPYYDCEIRMKHRDGRWIWVHDRGRLMKRTADGKPLMMFGTHTDVTLRKQAKEMLQTERDLLKRYLDTADAFIVTLDGSGLITSINSYALELLGYEEEEVLGKNWFELALPQPEGREKVYRVFQHIMNGDLSVYGYFENEVVTASGERKMIAWRNNHLYDADGLLKGLVSIGIDITEHRRVAGEYQKLFQEMMDGFALHEILCDGHGKPVDYRFLAVNPAFERMTGLKSEEILGKNVLDVMPGTERYWIETYGRVALTGEPAMFNNYAKELDKHFEVRAYSPSPGQFACIFMDVTERKRAEEALKKNEEKLGNILRNMTDVVWTSDLDLKTIFVSPSVETLFGVTPEEYIKQSMEEKVPPRSMDIIRSVMAEEFRNEKGPDCDRNRSRIMEFEQYRSDGTTVWTEMNVSFVRDGNGSAVGLQGATRDITERKRNEEKLRQAVQTTIQVLTQTVERRDPYTAGHQRRVAGLAAAISAEMGLAPERVEEIRMAGYVHDIGKISVPAEILSKPGHLSEVEMNIIREHPTHGREILANVESAIRLDEVVYQHHERMDGSGYPQGLKGKNILLEARILAVADVVEAMSSHRPYRASKGLDAALEEIESNGGILYCPDAVDACLRLFREKGYVLEE